LYFLCQMLHQQHLTCVCVRVCVCHPCDIVRRQTAPAHNFDRTLCGMTTAEPPLMPTIGSAVWVERKSRIWATSATWRQSRPMFDQRKCKKITAHFDQVVELGSSKSDFQFSHSSYWVKAKCHSSLKIHHILELWIISQNQIWSKWSFLNLTFNLNWQHEVNFFYHYMRSMFFNEWAPVLFPALHIPANEFTLFDSSTGESNVTVFQV